MVRANRNIMGATNDNNGGGAGDTGADDQEVNETVDEADTTKNSGAKDDADGSSSDAGDGSGSDDGEDDGEGDSKKGSDNAGDDTKDDEDDGAEPELRKPKHGASNAEWAAWRAQEKSKAKAADKDKKSGDDSNGDDVDDEDEDGLSPEDRAAFDKRIEKKLQPFQERAAEQEVEASIATFVKDNPDFAPFAAKAKRFAMHPSRQSVPIKSIFYEVAGEKLMRIGAQRAKAADAKSKQTKTGGGSTGGDQTGNKSYKDMPLKDFEKELEAVKTGGRR